MPIRFLGHSAFELTDGDVSVIIDPFLTGNPKAAVTAADVNPDVILLTHGHADHFGDTIEIAKRSGATVQAIDEIAREIAAHGITAIDTNIGGKYDYPWGSVRIVPALHTSTTPAGTSTLAGGLIIEIGGKRIYHAGDTALFSDLKLVKRYGPIDLAIVPIGGHYTMDRHDAVTAVEWIGAAAVVPCHYDTAPAIETDVQAFAADVHAAGTAVVHVMEPGDTVTL
jgi:L-ascorbate metabolism protein UlaG (beta-lactamase superfamily)